jgi:hypothetical protein
MLARHRRIIGKRAAPSKVKKVGILAAGMVGGGIAYASAKAGIDVVLLDSTQELADKGKAYSQGLVDGAIKKGRSTPEKRDALLRLRPADRQDANRVERLAWLRHQPRVRHPRDRRHRDAQGARAPAQHRGGSLQAGMPMPPLVRWFNTPSDQAPRPDPRDARGNSRSHAVGRQTNIAWERA